MSTTENTTADSSTDSSTEPTAPDTTRADDDAIRHTIAEAERHQNDVEPFLALHTDDDVIVNIAGTAASSAATRCAPR